MNNNEWGLSYRGGVVPFIVGLIVLSRDRVSSQHQLAQSDLLEIIKLLEIGDVIFLEARVRLPLRRRGREGKGS